MLMNHGKNSSSSNTNNSRWSSGFTASQWHELEHQALIFKYMSEGLPIPPDLIYPIRRSCPPPFPLLPSFSSSTTSPSSSLLFSHQPNIVGRWGYHQMGLGREPDPEPGRCRRTDGKKWRCSKEAFPDSKYCERHIHRGKNRSRKPVEMDINSTPISNTSTTTITSSSSTTTTNNNNHNLHFPFHYTPNPSPSPPQPPPPSTAFMNFPTQTHLSLDHGSLSSPHKDYRYFHGLREEVVGEHVFFSEPSGTARNAHADGGGWRSTVTVAEEPPAWMTSPPKRKSYSVLESLRGPQEQQHCFVLGDDFKPLKVEKEEEGEAKQTLRHFFDDEWPSSRNKVPSWIDIEQDLSNATQLSISIPAAASHHDFMFSSRKED
ncbi:Growth-regulating factor 1 [Acorus calamus]|uniref:Growth-regulating factor n=1 Tax=Acorus calamus TaxID=4465 RepID=A0AAV9EQC6_ACOCL|nr:Growth-regulating factor 1 [Acorus calamus]